MIIAPKENDVIRGSITGAIYRVLGLTTRYNMVLEVLVRGTPSPTRRTRNKGAVFTTSYVHFRGKVIGHNYKAKTNAR